MWLVTVSSSHTSQQFLLTLGVKNLFHPSAKSIVGKKWLRQSKSVQADSSLPVVLSCNTFRQNVSWVFPK
jgi:hypothetical protein